MSEQITNDTIAFDMPKNQSSVIKVIGVGGGGSNAVNHMYGMGIRGVDFVVCNTDSQALGNSPVPNKIQLGVTLTEGLGAGANPEIGQQAAHESIEEIKALLEHNTKMVFITAGMGGGTGTGAAPVIAKAAKDMGILTVGICTIPFLFEGNNRKMQAEKGVEQLRNAVDSLVVINNNKLREVYGNLGFKAGFAKADEVLATAARGIAEVITHHYTTNIDLRDAKTVLANSGTAIMGSATASGENRASEAIRMALDSPLLNDNHIRGAKNVLLLIVSGQEEITIDEIGEINDFIQKEAGGSANIIMGIGEDEDLANDVGVTIVATGFAPDQQVQVIGREPKKVVHPLEDDQAISNTVFNKPLPQNEEADSDDLIEKELARAKRTKAKGTPQPELFEFSQPEPEDNAAPEPEPQAAPEEHNAGVTFSLEAPEEMPDAEDEVEPSSHSNNEIKAGEEQETLAEEKQSPATEENEDDAMPVFEIGNAGEEDTRDNNRRVFVLEDEEPIKEPRASKPQETPTPKREEKPQARNEEKLIRYTLEDYTQLESQLKNAKPNGAGNNKSEPEDEEVNFSLKKSAESTQKRSQREVDPTEMTIEESRQLQAKERRAKLKAFNYRFKQNPYSIDETDNEPAYKRQGVKIEDHSYSSQNHSGRFSIEDGEHGTDIKTNNSFLHDNVD